MKYLPAAKNKEIVMQNLQDEVLIYDLKTNQAYCLNETAAKVFNACDGKTTFPELAGESGLTDDLIHLALAELKANDLLVDYQSDHFKGLSRREVIRKVGLASMIALPVIAGITAPIAAHAASTCTTGRDPVNGGGSTDGCICSLSGSQLQACNTRGGANFDPIYGCKPGCLCRVTNQQQCNDDGSYCNGFCG